MTDSASTAQAVRDEDALVGLSDMTVVGKDGTYRYVYSISRGAWVGTGSIDEGFDQFKFSPTMCACPRSADGSFRYAEKGCVFDLNGKSVGTFR